MIEPIDHEHCWEVCPDCGEEVMLDAELKVQTCPNCGMRIVPCSMCLACDTDKPYCSHCCLCYQAEMENKLKEEELKHQFTEVRCDFFDEQDGVWCVDAWTSPEDCDDDGEVIAKINPDTLEVKYNKPEFAKDELAHEVIRWRLHEITSGK